MPVLNKIDLPIARPDEVIAEMEQALGIEPDEVLRVSGKTGLGVEELLAGHHRPRAAAAGQIRRAAQALVFNSHFDTYKGVVVYVRIMDGTLHKGQRIKLMRGGTEHEVIEIGQFRPAMTAVRRTVGRAGRLLHRQDQEPRRCPHRRYRHRRLQPDRRARCRATRNRKPMVFSGLYPSTTTISRTLREALAKLQLNDSSFTFSPKISEGLGFGFRCGFLGMLHREIIQQRLERDSDLDLVQTAPNVTYEILTRKGEIIVIDNPQKVPDAGQIEEFREPIVQHQLPAAGREHRRPDAAVHRPPRHLRPHRIPESARGRSSSSNCRWRK